MKKIIILALVVSIILLALYFFNDTIENDTTNNTPESLINKYVNAINTKDWDTYVNLFNSTDKTKLELLEFLNNKEKAKQGLNSVKHAQLIDFYPATDSEYKKENLIVYDAKIKLDVVNESEFFQNGIRLNTFTFIEVDGKLLIDTVYFNGYVHKDGV